MAAPKRVAAVPLAAVAISLLVASPTVLHGQCLIEGDYTSSPTLSYTCAFNLVQWNVQKWRFQDLGGGNIRFSPIPAGTMPTLTGSINCQTSSFTASATLTGGCAETYTLQGQVTSPASWTGTFTRSYTPGSPGACFDCSGTTTPVSGTLPPTAVSGSRRAAPLVVSATPNPFSLGSTILVTLDSDRVIDLAIYDIQGRRVRELAHGRHLAAGAHPFVWDRTLDGGGLASTGVYFVRVRSSAATVVAKLVILD